MYGGSVLPGFHIGLGRFRCYGSVPLATRLAGPPMPATQSRLRELRRMARSACFVPRVVNKTRRGRAPIPYLSVLWMVGPEVVNVDVESGWNMQLKRSETDPKQRGRKC